MNINHIVVAGRLGGDPELKTTQGGSTVATFSIATNSTWKDKNGQKQQQTEWINCVAWGKTAEVISQYFKKGKEIYVEGRLQTSSWVDKNSVKRYKTQVIVSVFQFVGHDTEQKPKPEPKPQGAEQTFEKFLETGEQAPMPDNEQEVDIEDIPF